MPDLLKAHFVFFKQNEELLFLLLPSVMHFSWDFTGGYAGEERKHIEIVPLLLLRPHFLKQIFTLIIDAPRLQAKPSQLKDSRNKSLFVTAQRDYLCYLGADPQAASGQWNASDSP